MVIMYPERRTVFKQRQTGTFMGAIKIVISNISPYASWLSLALVGLMSFYTTISPIFAERGMVLPFWVFCLVLVLIIVTMAVLEWVFMLPSYYKANNVQSWNSGGPFRDIFETIEKELAEVKKMQIELRAELQGKIGDCNENQQNQQNESSADGLRNQKGS